MKNKNLTFGDDATDKLVSGLQKLSKAVGSTLGVHGNTVLLESPNHTMGMTATKDGVTVAKSINVSDAVEDIAIRVARQAAERTALTAGDGTSTSIVLADAITRYGVELIKGDPSINRTQLLRLIEQLAAGVVDELRHMSTGVSEENIVAVATISANNDRELGEVIASVYGEVGADGVVTVEKSDNADTYAETTHGVKIDRGYTSPLFVNEQARDEVVYEQVRVLVADTSIDSVLQIEQVLKPVVANRERLLIIAPCSQNVVNTLAANVMKNGLSLVNISPPSFGYKQSELMQDIAAIVGATYFSEKTGDDLSLISESDLGMAAKVVVSRHNTVLTAEPNEKAAARLEQLRDALGIARDADSKAFIKQRIATLAGGIGVIYVGGHTDMEMKERYDRVEDAVLAVRAALSEGVLAGSGAPLYHLGKVLEPSGKASREEQAAISIMSRAMMVPLLMMYENAGISPDDYAIDAVRGVDLRTLREGELIEMGVIDPALVTISALTNAVSVAKTLLGTNCVVTLDRDE